MDNLQITALRAMTHIGVHAWEQRILQSLVLDIQIPRDFTTCNDQLTNTIDYDQLCQLVTTYLETNTFNLIETVAEKVAQVIKEHYQIATLTLTVSKPHAIKNAGNVSVTITR